MNRLIFVGPHIYEPEEPFPGAKCQCCGDTGSFEFYDESEEIQSMPCIEDDCEAGRIERGKWDRLREASR